MPIFFLRHEERDMSDPSFFSPLTPGGRRRAVELIPKLEELQIDHVFCSPFLRCVQTVLPYCWKHGVHVRIDNSLYEYLSAPHFTLADAQTQMPAEMRRALGLQDGYRSITHVDEIEVGEYPLERVAQFVTYVKQVFSTTSVVLVCTHMDCINSALGNPRGTMIPMGGLVKLVDSTCHPPL